MGKSSETIAKELQEEIRKNVLLRVISHELNKLTTLENKVNTILEILDKRFNLHHTILLIPIKNNTAFRVFASRGFDESGIGSEIPYNYGIVGVVAKKKKKLRIARLSQFQRYAAILGGNKEPVPIIKGLPNLADAESQVVLPLIANDELVAVLSCESKDILFFHQSEEDFLMTLSEQIALSIQNSMVFDELEERVKNRTAALEKLNTTKDRLFGIIGHDLRSPVSALSEVANLFKYYSAKGDQEKLLALGDQISHAAENVNQLLDNLLNWSLSQKDEIRCAKEKIDVETIIDEVYLIFKDSILSKEIAYSQDIEKGAYVHADYNMLFSVLRNILSNAIKFTEPKGEISVHVSQSDNQVKILLKDNGVGIDIKKVNTLFSLQEKKSTLGTLREKGTGLGLVLVHEFVQINGGTIQLESSPAGTLVHLVLPKG